jgi:hypothetical protein
VQQLPDHAFLNGIAVIHYFNQILAKHVANAILKELDME